MFGNNVKYSKEILHKRNPLRSSYSTCNPLPPSEGLFFFCPIPCRLRPYYSAVNQRETKLWCFPTLCLACFQLLQSSLFFIVLIIWHRRQTNISPSSEVWAPWEQSLCPFHILFIFPEQCLPHSGCSINMCEWMTVQGISPFYPLTLFQGPWAGLLMETTKCCPSLPSVFQD